MGVGEAVSVREANRRVGLTWKGWREHTMQVDAVAATVGTEEGYCDSHALSGMWDGAAGRL